MYKSSMTDGSSLIKSKGLGGHSIIQSYVAGISYFPYILSFTGELLCKLVNFLPVQCILTSVYTLVAMSYERRRAVVQHHLPAVSSRSSLIACILIWVAALAASIPTFIEFTVFEVLEPSGDPGVTTVVGMVSTEEPQHYRQCGHHHHGRLSVLINGVFLLVIAYVIPLSLMLGYYGNIAIFIINKTKTVSCLFRGLEKYNVTKLTMRLQSYIYTIVFSNLILIQLYFRHNVSRLCMSIDTTIHVNN